MNRRLVLAVVVLVAAGAIAWRYYPRPAPDIGSGPPIVDVKVPELSAAARAGKAVFDENCAVCHGADAAGRQGVAPPLVHIIYEPNHHADEAFYRAAKLGVRSHHWPFGDMPPVDGITDAEVGRIVTYVRALQLANGID